MPKFTPGPWRISGSVAMKQGIACPFIAHGDAETFSPIIAEIYADGGGLPVQANAHLIAAAPEMHAKLDNLATWLERNAALKESWIKTCRFESINDEERANAKNFRATAADIRRLLAKADGEE